jgi:hypothetical protein
VRRSIVVVTCALLLFTSCSNGSKPPAAASSSSAGPPASTTTTKPSATTTSTTALPVDEGNCALGSSPSLYDPTHGTYAVYLTGIDPGPRTLTFDVIQWLVGDDAVQAYHRDNPEDPDGPPNDYYIVNESPKTFTSVVAQTVKVRLVRLAQTGDASLKPGTFDELPAYLSNPQTRDPDSNALSFFSYWLTIKDSQIVGICEQFRP